MSYASEQLLDERYGRTHQRRFDRRLGWAIAAALVLLGLVVVIFGNWHGNNSSEGKVVSFTALSESEISVDYTVTARQHQAVACAIEAVSASFSTVGWKVVELPASAEVSRSFTETLRTSFPAASVSIRSCWSPQY